MSFLLTCPNCGTREVTDFGYGGEVTVATRVASGPAGAQRLQLLPPQHRRRAARVVVPPLGLPRLVHRRARHDAPTRSSSRRCPARPTTADAGGGEGAGGWSREPAAGPARASGSTAAGRSASRSTASTIPAFEGDTIASALYAAGRRTFSRSFKYHRPRGELCGCGQCANSLVQIGGRPGVRACAEPAVDGMEVEHTNARPGLDFDVMRATDIVGGPFTPPGFYYKTFIRPRRLWPLYEKVLRSAAGLGVLPKQAGRARRGAPSTAAATATCS